jgi:hypothetical protein
MSCRLVGILGPASGYHPAKRRARGSRYKLVHNNRITPTGGSPRGAELATTGYHSATTSHLDRIDPAGVAPRFGIMAPPLTNVEQHDERADDRDASSLAARAAFLPLGIRIHNGQLTDEPCLRVEHPQHSAQGIRADFQSRNHTQNIYFRKFSQVNKWMLQILKLISSRHDRCKKVGSCLRWSP